MTEPITMGADEEAEYRRRVAESPVSFTMERKTLAALDALRAALAEIEVWARSNGFQLENNEGYEDEDREDGRTTPAYRWMNEDGDVLIDVDTLPEAIAAYDRLMTAGWDKCSAKLAEAKKETGRLREFAERVITPCPWGPSAFVEGEEADIDDWARISGILVPYPHAQPCPNDDCECDGADTLLYFAWKPPALDAARQKEEAE